MEYLTTVEMSERWNITPGRIWGLCSEGRIEGAIKKVKHGLFRLILNNLLMQDSKIKEENR